MSRKSEFEDTTIEELMQWANRLGLCEFEISKRSFEEDYRVVARGGKKVYLGLFLGRYDESVSDIGGLRCVRIRTEDRRNGGFAGHGCSVFTWRALESVVLSSAVELGIELGQMAMF